MLKILFLLALTVAVGTLPILWAAALLTNWGAVYVFLGFWVVGVPLVAMGK